MSNEMTNTSAGAIMAELASAIKKTFTPKHPAQVEIAEDPAHAIDLLAAGKSGGMSIVLFYLGDAGAGDDDLPEDVLVEGQIRIGVVKHQGLAVKPTSRVAPVLTEAEALRTFIARLLSKGTVTTGYEYAGMTYLKNNNGELLHGYALTYKALYAYEV